ncbi:MAG: isocitrate/isopropylmalate family dehydrogenase, partial [Bacillus sp. (in: firmicutes)]
GKGIANPLGQIWTAKMMLDHFGEEELGILLLDAIDNVTNEGILTPDLGGSHSTEEVTEEIIRKLKIN